MDNKELNRYLRSEARVMGLCDQWYDGWEKDSTRQELIEKYVRGIDFCISHDFPCLDFIRENFPRFQLRENGIYVDEGGVIERAGVVIVLGDSDLVVRVSGFMVCTLYVRHGSHVDVDVSGSGRVFIECYDESVVRVSAVEESKAFVYHYGGSVEFEGSVVVREKG